MEDIINELPHPRYGDTAITLSVVKRARRIATRRILSSALTYDIVSCIQRRPDIARSYELYSTIRASSDIIAGISTYALINNEYTWTKLEDGLRMRLNNYNEGVPKIKIVRTPISAAIVLKWSLKH